MPYQIGVTLGNMQELTDLGIPDPLYQPLSDFTPWSELRTRGDGSVVGMGRPGIVWRFNELSLRQMGTLLYYVTTAGVLQASKTCYIYTRRPVANMTDRAWAAYKVLMLCPLEPDDARYQDNRKYQDVEVKFIQAVWQNWPPDL